MWKVTCGQNLIIRFKDAITGKRDKFTYKFMTIKLDYFFLKSRPIDKTYDSINMLSFYNKTIFFK